MEPSSKRRGKTAAPPLTTADAVAPAQQADAAGAGGVGRGRKEAALETGRRVPEKNQRQKNGRRAASGTTAAAQEALAQASAGWPRPPVGLRAAEVACWESIMVARLPQQWAQVDLLHAANLARCLAAIESNQQALDREGHMTGRGKDRRINPRHALVETLNRRAMALTRVLQLHAVATIGPKGKQPGTKGEAEQAAGALRQTSKPAAPGAFDADQLLASPTRLQ